mgnify:CR=1 FL=1
MQVPVVLSQFLCLQNSLQLLLHLKPYNPDKQSEENKKYHVRADVSSLSVSVDIM